MKNVEVIISPDGSSIKIEAHEFKGESCISKTRDLINSLGTVTDSGTTPDFYLTEGVEVGA